MNIIKLILIHVNAINLKT